MAYTYDQLVLAYTAIHDGIGPDAATQATFQIQAVQSANGQLTDAQLMSNIVNSADSTTGLAVMAYEFFTGKSPTKAGVDYLVNSLVNNSDLNDAYYSKFSLENRYINFAANLGLQGEGAANFAAKYGALSFSDYVASIYQTIVGASYAAAAGIDASKAIADIISRKDAILATATSAGMIPANATAAQIDITLKAATAGYLLGEAIKADIGLYDAANNNLMVAMAQGVAVYNTDITYTYQPSVSTPAHGTTGRAVDQAPSNLPVPIPPTTTPPATSLSAHAFVLTVGNDTFTGESLNDTFTGTNLTFNAADILDGGPGADTLTIAAAVGSYTAPAATVHNIETATITNTGGLTLNTGAWTGLTTLNTTSVGGVSLSSASTTDMTVNANTLGAGAATVDGGHNVTLNVTGLGAGVVQVGSTTAPTGVLTINADTSTVGNQITATGAGNINITQTTSNAANTTATLAQVTVHGGAATNAVTIHNRQAVPASVVAPGIVSNTVNVWDGVSSGGSGVIPLIDIDGFSAVNIHDSGLSTLKLANSVGAVSIVNTGSAVTTLNLNLDNSYATTFSDSNVYTTLNINVGTIGSPSYLATLSDTALTTLNVSGASPLRLYDSTNTNLHTVTVTGSASFGADLTQSGTVTLVDTTGTTGLTEVMINGATTTYTGGAGVDHVLLTTGLSQTLSLGGGDDIVVLASGTTSLSATINGGLGVDTLQMAAADAATASASGAFAAQLSGLEHLTLTSLNNQTIDVGQLGFHYVTTGLAGGATLNGLVSGDTVELNDTGTSYIIGGGNFGGGADTLNLKLTDSASVGLNFASTGFQLTGVETLNITTFDGSTPPAGVVESLVLSGTGVQTIVASGNAGLNIEVTASTSVSSVDGGAITVGGLQYTQDVAPAGAITVKGAASSDNTITMVATYSGTMTYTGGAGADTVSVGSGANAINVGAGTDRVNILAVNANSDTVFTAITGMGVGDTVKFASNGANAMGAQITGQASLAAYLNAASTDAAAATNTLHWFVFAGDTYIVSDVSNAATFQAGADSVVKLVGVTALNVGAATVAAGVITFA